MLDNINHDAPGPCWCGPAALASVSGINSTAFWREALKAANKRVANNPDVGGLFFTELARALQAVGEPVLCDSMPREGTRLADIPRRLKPGQRAVVFVLGHFVAVDDEGWFADNTRRNPVPLALLHRNTRNRRVQAVLVVGP